MQGGTAAVSDGIGGGNKGGVGCLSRTDATGSETSDPGRGRRCRSTARKTRRSAKIDGAVR
jgi:hypothetical protein